MTYYHEETGIGIGPPVLSGCKSEGRAYCDQSIP